MLGVLRIASTFRTFSATIDESTHIGTGLTLIEHHRFLQFENPPLAPIILAAIPWLSGTRFDPNDFTPAQLDNVFFEHGKYEANLVHARVGNLLFFFVAAVGLFLAAADSLGSRGGLIALLLFTTQPVVLGYPCLATPDAAATAGVSISILAYSRWVRAPDIRRAFAMGSAFGFSVLCKFSCIGYVPAACGVMYAVRLLRDPATRRAARGAVLTLIPAATIAAFVIWAGYGFTIGNVNTPWLPAPAFFTGVRSLMKLNTSAYRAYLCGTVSYTGWWWYFPFAVVLKTTLSFLALFLVGATFALREHDLRGPFVESALAAAAVIALAMPSSLDIGVRYVLPLYVPLTIAAAAGAMAMLRARQVAMRACAVALIVAHLGASAAAHPDYFPYFNLLAGRDPSRFLIDSNLDWGQDVLRLRHVLRQRKIEHIGLNLLAPNDYDALGFPPHSLVSARVPAQGWIAVSDHMYRMIYAEGGWKWLPQEPQVRVGKSIRLYLVGTYH